MYLTSGNRYHCKYYFSRGQNRPKLSKMSYFLILPLVSDYEENNDFVISTYCLTF